MRKRVEVFALNGSTYYRAHVWTLKGYSSKTFMTPAEAALWAPKKS